MKLTRYLLGFLVVQIIILIGLYLSMQSNNQAKPTKALLPLTLSNIQKLEIAEGDKALMLVKEDNTWLLPSLDNLPANQHKIKQLLAKLTATEVNWPVTTSESSHERFQVDKENFQRKITFYTGDQEKTQLFLGTSPSFRKVHSRVDNADEVYVIEFNNFEASNQANDWLDKKLLAVQAINKISTANLSLSKVDDHWQFEQQEYGQVDQDKIKDYLQAINQLIIERVADKKLKSNQPEMVITVASSDGKIMNLSLLKVVKSNDKSGEQNTQSNADSVQAQYYIKEERYPSLFGISKTTYDTLSAFTLDKLRLVQESDQQTPAQPTPSQPTPSQPTPSQQAKSATDIEQGEGTEQ